MFTIRTDLISFSVGNAESTDDTARPMATCPLLGVLHLADPPKKVEKRDNDGITYYNSPAPLTSP